MLPRNCIAGDKVPTVLMQSDTPREDLLLWLAIANSFVMDFLVRMKISLKMALTVLDSLPFPRLSSGNPVARRLARRALMLSCTGVEMNDLWDEMVQVGIVAPRPIDGVPGTTDPGERLQLVAENEADVALLYGLNSEDLAHILDTFPIVRRHDEKAHAGEYHTKTLILGAYDGLVDTSQTARPYATQLDPTPANERVAYPPTSDPLALPEMPVVIPAYSDVEKLVGWIFATLAASGGGMRRTDLACALSLRNDPELLVRHASGEAVAAARAWAPRVARRSMPVGMLYTLLQELESRGAVRFFDQGAAAMVGLGSGAPSREDLDSWSHFEAVLALRVLAGLPALDIADLQGRVAEAERAFMSIGVA
jgi:hypothetical protein